MSSESPHRFSPRADRQSKPITPLKAGAIHRCQRRIIQSARARTFSREKAKLRHLTRKLRSN